MDEAYKPYGYPSVAPYLVVHGADRTIAVLETVFGARVLRRDARADGSIVHAEVRIDDTVVMLADEVTGFPAMPSHVHVYVADVDAAYREALAAGCRDVQAPVDDDDGDRRGGFEEPGGTTWWVATRIELDEG
jgi:PhnB protein